MPKPSPRRRSRAEWRTLIDELERTGEHHVAFAKRHGVNAGTLRKWLYRLRCERAADLPVPFVELSPATTAAPSTSLQHPPCRIRTGRVDIEFPEAPEAVWVARLVAALERPPC